MCALKVTAHKLTTTVGAQGVDGKAGPPLNVGARGGGKTGFQHPLVGVNSGLKDSLVCLTSEELQQILNTVNTSVNAQTGPEQQAEQCCGNDVTVNPTCSESDDEDDKLCAFYLLGQTDPKCVSSVNEEGREIREEDKGGGEELMDEGGADATRSSQEKDGR